MKAEKLGEAEMKERGRVYQTPAAESPTQTLAAAEFISGVKVRLLRRLILGGGGTQSEQQSWYP